jgi:hypothetical protein
MKYRIILTLGIPLLFLMNACCQISSEQTNTERLLGKWSVADSVSFRGKEIEFLPDHQVTLILANGGRQDGQYEIRENTIIFSIGDAPPFAMNFRFEAGQLFLSSPGGSPEMKYLKTKE